MLSEEEKEAIKILLDMNCNKIAGEKFTLNEKAYIGIAIGLIYKLQKENENLIKEKEENKYLIAMANNEMLGYNQGYSDGKNQNRNATEIIIKNRQAYVHKEEVELLQKKIEKYKYLYQKALDNTVKADKKNIQLKKQINLMIEEIRKTILIVKPESKFCQYEEDCKNIRCKDCIKQYFEKQAKEI